MVWARRFSLNILNFLAGLFNLAKNLSPKSSPPKFQTLSIHKIAHNHNLAQRQNSRVAYAHLGAVGDLPQVYYSGDEMNVANISSGGLLIIDDANQLGSTVGQSIQLELRWQDFSCRTKARIVGANLQRRHVQFGEINSTALQRIERAVECGTPGLKFYQAHTTAHPAGSAIEALEVWLDPAGNSLVFPKLDGRATLAEVNYNGKKYSMSAQKWPFDSVSNRLLTPEEISEILIFLANFKTPSPRIRYLIEKLNFLYVRPRIKKTGS